MGISSAMYAAVTGLSALGTGMQTISNNIANVNTVGFKAGRTNYEDLISQSYFSGGSGRVNQRGCGVKVSTIQNIFSQGAFMASAQDTDMAIAGDGFFTVRHAFTNEKMYTRAGNFTLNKDGYLEDPSGNILQGWQMSIPKPGMDAVKIGAPTDVKITVLNAPPVETSHMKVAVNLDADKDPSYYYDEYAMAHKMADEIAVPLAESARTAASLAVWDPDNPATAQLSGTRTVDLTTNGTSAKYQEFFVEEFNKLAQNAGHTPPYTAADMASVYVIPPPPPAQPDPVAGQMTNAQFNSICTIVEAAMVSEAALAGKTAYTVTYNDVYTNTKKAIASSLPGWQAEGKGFAGAWNPQNEPYIDTSDGNIHMEPMIIYDSLGSEHKLMVYYQKNPHEDNIWDYIITCDPLEDGRLDSNTPPSMLLTEQASFAGLIQKGKITFSADGADRHGGLIKDLEAQNIDLANSKMARADKNEASYSAGTTATMRNATIGGYYTGPSKINNDFTYGVSGRSYQIAWGAPSGIDLTDKNAVMAALADPTATWDKYVNQSPQTEGLIWWDAANNEYGFIAIDDPEVPGPYKLGNDGLTISFDQRSTPLQFGQPGQDTMQIDAYSEQLAWKDLDTNESGYFDFEVAFVNSADMAPHPPYYQQPAIVQKITFDMGAKRNLTGSDPKWILDSLGTTQFATKFSTTFAGQDGFPPGSLQRISVGEDGVITGVYTNGRHQALYQVGLTRFLNPWGLDKMGDNLYAETRYSGQGVMNEPGFGGTGTILGNFLEQSNVDLADEIVSMIVTQRGFQANSKTVTTTDTMMAEIIEMKR